MAKLWVILAKTTTQQGYRRGGENKKPCDGKKIASNPRQSYPAQDLGPAATPGSPCSTRGPGSLQLLALESQAGRRQCQLEQGV